MCKCCTIKCFPDPKVVLKCGCFYLTYFKIRFLLMLFSFGIFFFDIASDIMVLIDLDNTNSEYFNMCLVVMLLPTFYNIVNTIRNWPHGLNLGDKSCFQFFCGVLWLFMKTVLQINIIFSAIEVLKKPYSDANREYMSYRMNESLLESAPQSLFQLFIILKNAHIYSINQISIYYISITVSILSLVVSLISYEINMFNSGGRAFYLIRNLINSNNFEGEFNIRNKFLKKNTFYVALLSFFRLTEVISRIGLLSSIGIIYDGSIIIWFLLADFFIILLFNFGITINNFTHICTTWPPWHWSGATWRECGWWFRQIVVLQIYLSLSLEFILSQVKNLAIYNGIFIFIVKYIKDEEVDPPNMGRYEKKRISVLNKTSKFSLITHFTSRYLNNLILSILIIYNLRSNTYSKSLTIISISSICCFILNIISLPFLIKYIYNYKKYYKVFKPINLLKYCKCCECCNSLRRNSIRDNTTSESKESNVISEHDEEHPDDIVI